MRNLGTATAFVLVLWKTPRSKIKLFVLFSYHNWSIYHIYIYICKLLHASKKSRALHKHQKRRVLWGELRWCGGKQVGFKLLGIHMSGVGVAMRLCHYMSLCQSRPTVLTKLCLNIDPYDRFNDASSETWGSLAKPFICIPHPVNPLQVSLLGSIFHLVGDIKRFTTEWEMIQEIGPTHRWYLHILIITHNYSYIYQLVAVASRVIKMTACISKAFCAPPTPFIKVCGVWSVGSSATTGGKWEV